MEDDEPGMHSLSDGGVQHTGANQVPRAADVNIRDHLSRGVANVDERSDDDDDSLYAVGPQTRLHPLRAYWERRHQENPNIDMDDSSMSGEESELERMLVAGSDTPSEPPEPALSGRNIDCDFSEEDADLYIPHPRLAARHKSTHVA